MELKSRKFVKNVMIFRGRLEVNFKGGRKQAKCKARVEILSPELREILNPQLISAAGNSRPLSPLMPRTR